MAFENQCQWTELSSEKCDRTLKSAGSKATNGFKQNS